MFEEEGMTRDTNLLQLFQSELIEHAQKISEGLLAVEGEKAGTERYHEMMRAAHSIKGAARIVGLGSLVDLSHGLEEYFQKCYQNEEIIEPDQVDILLQIVDALLEIGKAPSAKVLREMERQREKFSLLSQLMPSFFQKSLERANDKEEKLLQKGKQTSFPSVKSSLASSPSEERFIRVSTQNLNRLVELAAESVVAANGLRPFLDSLLSLKKKERDLAFQFESLFDTLHKQTLKTGVYIQLDMIKQGMNIVHDSICRRIEEFEVLSSRQSNVAERFYDEVIHTRMRPFSDLSDAFPRFVRDLAKQLGKKVRLLIKGKNTPVDREILERLEAPLSHILRNSVDHGIESPEERKALGKEVTGTIVLEAVHKGGMLCIHVSDDGQGIDVTSIKKEIEKKHLVLPETLKRMDMQEILSFLFLPGFSTAGEVTLVSGRGFGLSIVQEMVQEVGGSVKLETGEGVTLRFQLPLTLSVLPTLLVNICGEKYAFALSQISSVVSCPRKNVQKIEDRYYFEHEKTNIGIVFAYEFLGLEPKNKIGEDLPIVVISDNIHSYGVVVDAFLGQKELVVQELDPRLGKVCDIYAGAFAEDGSPILILDIEDMMHSIDKTLSSERRVEAEFTKHEKKIQQILVVDDSVTVRQVQKRVLENYGYKVDTAINGVDAWNAISLKEYDLLITDIDMPKMNGLELIRLMRQEEKSKKIPIIIVSYKESEEDKERGLGAGANLYLTKSSFQDDSLVESVRKLIGQRGKGALEILLK